MLWEALFLLTPAYCSLDCHFHSLEMEYKISFLMWTVCIWQSGDSWFQAVNINTLWYWGQAVNINTFYQFISSRTHLMDINYTRIALGIQAPVCLFFNDSLKFSCSCEYTALHSWTYSQTLVSSRMSPCSTYLFLTNCDVGNLQHLRKLISSQLDSKSRDGGQSL